MSLVLVDASGGVAYITWIDVWVGELPLICGVVWDWFGFVGWCYLIAVLRVIVGLVAAICLFV